MLDSWVPRSSVSKAHNPRDNQRNSIGRNSIKKSKIPSISKPPPPRSSTHKSNSSGEEIMLKFNNDDSMSLGKYNVLDPLKKHKIDVREASDEKPVKWYAYF